MIASFLDKLPSFFFAAPGDACSLPQSEFFFLPRWWQYLDGKVDFTGACTVDFNFPGDIWLVGLAVLNMLVRIAGFAAVIMIIVAGIELITSQGSTEKGVSARNRIINALTGLGIAMIATGVISFLGSRIGGPDGGAQALPHAPANEAAIAGILNIIFVILGALAVLFVVIAGFRFVMSRGDPAKLADARRQIVYAIVGLAVVATSATIVNFVVNSVEKGNQCINGSIQNPGQPDHGKAC